MRKQWLVLLVAVLAAATLWGCGSSGSSGGSDEVTTIADVDTVGILNCVKCHSSATPETASWLTSTHGNSNGVLRYGDDRGPHDETSSCQPCHNQLLDGDKLDEAFTAIVIGDYDDDPANGPVLANGERDIVSCESCHGPGSAHRGIGPIAYPRPDWEQCVACHDHAEGVRHADDYGMLASSVGASAHNNSDDLHASSAKCQRCHTAEGSVAFTMYTGDKNVMEEMDEDQDDVASLGAEEDLHPVTCAACHIPHDDSGRWEAFIVNDNDVAAGDWDPNGNAVADQFDFCTSCHTYYNQDGTLIGSGSVASGTAPFYHNTAWYRTITSTHYDDPTTGYGEAESIIEGYVIRTEGANPCFDCHGHELRTNTRRSRDVAGADDNAADFGSTIHTQWATSRHGGKLLEAKYAAADATASRTEEQVDAVMAAGREDGEGHGWSWTHYDWDSTSRQSCQRCHSSTGASNFMDDPATYDPANNDFSHLEGWAAGGTPSSVQNEMLYCWGCHSNAGTGLLREPGAIVEEYDPLVTVTYPDIAGSNVCMSCHLGREVGEVIKVTVDADGVRNFINSHYLSAGAQLFAEGGYEYDGLDYANVTFFAHDKIGTVDEPGTGENGPCVACHMSAEESHLFSPVEKDHTTGEITAITASVCIVCHDGGHGPAFVAKGGDAADVQAAADFMIAEEEEYAAALNALSAALASQGIFYDPSSYPYFFTTDDPGTRANYTDWAAPFGIPEWQNVMGAAFNLNLLGHDPGGYAHNRFYVKALIWDSIDYIYDGTIDNSVVADIQALETATLLSADDSAAAQVYLGTSRPGDGSR